MLRKRIIQSIIAIALFALALPASADTCVQTDGQPGIQLVGVEGDAGCQTAEEYAAVFSVENLTAEGVITSSVDNGDGTVTATINGAAVILKSDPLDRPVAANPDEFSEAPTVREVLYPRAAYGVHPS